MDSFAAKPEGKVCYTGREQEAIPKAKEEPMRTVIELAAIGLGMLFVMLVAQAVITVARQQGDDTPDPIDSERRAKQRRRG